MIAEAQRSGRPVCRDAATVTDGKKVATRGSVSDVCADLTQECVADRSDSVWRCCSLVNISRHGGRVGRSESKVQGVLSCGETGFA